MYEKFYNKTSYFSRKTKSTAKINYLLKVIKINEFISMHWTQKCQNITKIEKISPLKWHLHSIIFDCTIFSVDMRAAEYSIPQWVNRFDFPIKQDNIWHHQHLVLQNWQPKLLFFCAAVIAMWLKNDELFIMKQTAALKQTLRHSDGAVMLLRLIYFNFP